MHEHLRMLRLKAGSLQSELRTAEERLEREKANHEGTASREHYYRLELDDVKAALPKDWHPGLAPGKRVEYMVLELAKMTIALEHIADLRRQHPKCRDSHAAVSIATAALSPTSKDFLEVEPATKDQRR